MVAFGVGTEFVDSTLGTTLAPAAQPAYLDARAGQPGLSSLVLGPAASARHAFATSTDRLGAGDSDARVADGCMDSALHRLDFQLDRPYCRRRLA